MWWKTFMDAVNLIWSAMNGEHLKYTEYNRITNMSTFRPVFADKMVYLLFRILVTGKRTVLVNQRGGLFQNWFVEFHKWAFICLESQMLFLHGMHDSTMYIGQIIKWFLNITHLSDTFTQIYDWTFNNFYSRRVEPRRKLSQHCFVRFKIQDLKRSVLHENVWRFWSGGEKLHKPGIEKTVADFNLNIPMNSLH